MRRLERNVPWRLGRSMLRDVTRLEAGSLLRDVSRLGNDNHSQIARIKKPSCWGLCGLWVDEVANILETWCMVNRIIFVVSGPYTIDLDYTKTFVTSDVNHWIIPYEWRDGRLTPRPLAGCLQVHQLLEPLGCPCPWCRSFRPWSCVGKSSWRYNPYEPSRFVHKTT